MGNLQNTDTFIKRSQEIHKDEYDYSESEYKGMFEKLKIKCKEHGIFTTTPNNHIHNKGKCPKCQLTKCASNRSKNNRETFVEKVSKLFPQLDFTDTVYVNAMTKVKYACPKHGVKEALPYNLLKGHGCVDCRSKKPTLSKEIWANRFEETGSILDYSELSTNLHSEKITKFKCLIHGSFYQTPLCHLKSKGCPKCNKERTAANSKNNPIGWSYTNWEKAGNKSKNFDSFKVYIIKCFNETETFYKIGKTFKTIQKRFVGKKTLPYNYEIIETYTGEAREMSILENSLKNLHLDFKYQPFLKFDGQFECFSKIVNPAYTSQTCSSCKHVDKNSRINQSEFNCTLCGHTENADLNGSKVILGRAFPK